MKVIRRIELPFLTPSSIFDTMCGDCDRRIECRGSRVEKNFAGDLYCEFHKSSKWIGDRDEYNHVC